jgi:hypothetical protein
VPKTPIKAIDVAHVAGYLRDAIESLPEHHACGVDSFSIQQQAMEYLDDEGFTCDTVEEIYGMDKMSAATCRYLIFSYELEYSVTKLQAGIKVEDVLRDIRERFDMDEVSDEELFKNHLVDYEE